MTSYQWNNINLSPKTLAMTFNEEVDATMIPITTQFCCCDDEIVGFKDPIQLTEFGHHKWELLETKNETCDHTTYRFVSYKYGNDILMAIKCEYPELPDDAEMLVYISKEYFMIVGVIGSHPFVETPYLSYCNSDGSGPNILEIRGADDSVFDKGPAYIAENLIYYYYRFTQNYYH
jgi:hypothetical protein